MPPIPYIINMEAARGGHALDTAAINRYIDVYSEIGLGLATDEESHAMYRNRLVFELLVLERALNGERAYPIE